MSGARHIETPSPIPNSGSTSGELFSVESTVCRAKGRVRIIIEEDGVETLHWDDPNLVVDIGRTILADLFFGMGDQYAANYIALGTGGHAIDNILVPVDPQFTDIALEIPAFQKVFTTKEKLDDKSLRFTIFLDKGEANGTGTIAYTESGLYTANARMFARETFPALVKTPTRSITFIWDILF